MDHEGDSCRVSSKSKRLKVGDVGVSCDSREDSGTVTPKLGLVEVAST